MPSTMGKEIACTLRLRQKVKRDKIVALYRHLNVTKGATLKFYNLHKWVSLTKQKDTLLATKTLTYRFGKVNALKNFQCIDDTSSALERSFKGATKLNRELPTGIEMELSS